MGKRSTHWLPDSGVVGWDLGAGSVEGRESEEKGEGEEGRAIDLTI